MPNGRAVSPVVAVILMVAVTVILAGTVSVFALGFVEDIREPSPTLGVEAEFEAREDIEPHWRFTITHISGDNIDAENLEIRLVDNLGGKAERVYPRSFSAGKTIRMGLWGSPNRANETSCVSLPETAPGVTNDQLVHQPSRSVMDQVTVDLSQMPRRFTGDNRLFLIDGSRPSFGCDDYRWR
jgi:flagellin-like protein